MSEYQPDNWVIIQIKDWSDPPFYKVLAGLSGGYLDGNSWRMNSGIVKTEQDGDYFLFYGYSDSVYRCHKNSYGLRMNNSGIWETLKQTVKCKLVPEDTNWMELNNDC